jgi:hypothetical protein
VLTGVFWGSLIELLTSDSDEAGSGLQVSDSSAVATWLLLGSWEEGESLRDVLLGAVVQNPIGFALRFLPHPVQ